MSTIGGRLLGVTLAALLTIGCGRGSTTAGMGTALAPVAGGVTVVVQTIQPELAASMATVR